MTPKLLITMGAVLAGVGVAAGAFGAHGLSEILTPERLGVFETAVRYHLIHAVAMIMAGILAQTTPTAPVFLAGYLFLAGILLFSGSLYLLVLTDTPRLGIITPFGGTAWIIGWGALAIGVWKSVP